MIRRLAALLVTLSLAASSAYAEKTPPAPIAKSSGQVVPTEPDEAALQTHDHYKNKAGQSVHSPAKSKTGAVPTGASAKCGDGSYSFSKNHRGTCSHHGGVETWLN